MKKRASQKRHPTYYRRVVSECVRDVLIDLPGVFVGYDKRRVLTLECGHVRTMSTFAVRHKNPWCPECCRLKLNGRSYP